MVMNLTYLNYKVFNLPSTRFLAKDPYPYSVASLGVVAQYRVVMLTLFNYSSKCPYDVPLYIFTSGTRD